jgi:peptidoglycan/xylan/chitin deacetylase (PgdA/CDA1 family)
VASNRLVILDELRVPYEVVEEVDPDAGGTGDPFPLSGFAALWQTDRPHPPALRWPSGPAYLGGAACLSYIDGIPLFARLAPDAVLREQAAKEGWVAAVDLLDEGERLVGAVWREPNGSLVLPFDPNEAIQNLTMERYRAVGRRGHGRGSSGLPLRAYYLLRPVLPRSLQLAMRRMFSRVQARARFPRWPYEPARHDLARRFHGFVTEITDAPPPWIAPWPRPYSWALVLTHDVETAVGYRGMLEICDMEEARGFRSSWNFVPRRYNVEDAMISQIADRGFEVGIHGLHHDGRDLESPQMIRERLPEIREYADRWNAAGFRAPGTQRHWEWMGLLGFDYDSSFPDTDPYEPQPGGSCSWLPFFIEDLVELPITLPQDHTLFVILRRAGAATWIDKARQLRERGGLALMLTHPDYMIEPTIAVAYADFLGQFQHDASVWQALPRDVAAWWRRRAASHLEPVGDGWRVVGPAAGEAVVETRAPS